MGVDLRKCFPRAFPHTWLSRQKRNLKLTYEEVKKPQQLPLLPRRVSLKRESTVKKNKMLFDKIGYYLGSFTPVFAFFPCLPSKPSSPRFYPPFPFSLPFCPLSFTSKQESNSGKYWDRPVIPERHFHINLR